MPPTASGEAHRSAPLNTNESAAHSAACASCFSLESALDELAGLLRGKAREMYPQLIERLTQVELMAGGIGWGYGDRVFEVVEDLKDALSPSAD